MTTPLDQLESRVHDLINKIGELHGENQRLNDQLYLSRQDFQAQSRELENERRRAQEAESAVQAAASLPDGNSNAFSERIEQLERELENQRRHAEEVVAAAHAAASLFDNGSSELAERIDYQTKQIELLERERIALRDQVSFMQNTLQTKEKDWQGKIDLLRQEKEQQTAAEAGYKQQLQALEAEKERLDKELTEQQNRFAEQEGSLKAQTASTLSLQEQLDAAISRQAEQQADFETQINTQREQADTKLLQEQERFRMEYALLVEKHEQNLGDLTQAMNVQKERLVEERQKLQQQLSLAEEQNSQYRQLLSQSAADIRRLLARLPQPESEPSESNGEAA